MAVIPMRWSDPLGIRWRRSRSRERDKREREEACREGEAARGLAAYIDRQTDYLVRRGELNGFSAQLRDGFSRGTGGDR